MSIVGAQLPAAQPGPVTVAVFTIAPLLAAAIVPVSVNVRLPPASTASALQLPLALVQLGVPQLLLAPTALQLTLVQPPVIWLGTGSANVTPAATVALLLTIVTA